MNDRWMPLIEAAVMCFLAVWSGWLSFKLSRAWAESRANERRADEAEAKLAEMEERKTP